MGSSWRVFTGCILFLHGLPVSLAALYLLGGLAESQLTADELEDEYGVLDEDDEDEEIKLAPSCRYLE